LVNGDLFDRAFQPLENGSHRGPHSGGVLGLVEHGGQRIVRATGLAQRVPDTRSMQ